MPPFNKTGAENLETKHHEEDIIPNTNIEPIAKLPIYDQLLSKDENRLLTYLRGWERRMGFITPLKWTNIIFIALLHIISLVWFAYNLSQGYLPKWQTVAFCKYPTTNLYPAHQPYFFFNLLLYPTENMSHVKSYITYKNKF